MKTKTPMKGGPKGPPRGTRKRPQRKKVKPKAPRFEPTGHLQNYAQIAFDYARAAIADTAGERHGKYIRLAAKRFMKDLKRAGGKRPAFIFDPWSANDPCDFIERLPHVEGQWDSPTIDIHPSHAFFVVQLFGFRNKDGSRRYTVALFNVARKNAKSTLAAAIELYCLCCEDDPGAQVISAATTFDQAEIIFKIAKRMVEKNHALAEHFGLECFAKAIARYDTAASFKPIHAKASTQDGLNPSVTALDEVHAHKTPDLLNVLQSAGGARKNPLWLYTTTEGYLNAGPWSELRDFARKILTGVFGVQADHFLAVIFAVDRDDDEFDESAWRKANPLMDVNPILLDKIRNDAVEAKAMPSKMAEFRIKRLNRQSQAAQGHIDIPKWRRCGARVDLDALVGAPCWGGLDLSSTVDITSWRMVWLYDGRWFTWGRNWVPADAVKTRTERGTVPYQGWVESGHITETPGNVVDYDIVEAEILEDWERFDVRIVAYDTWNATASATRLQAEGVTVEQFIQGPKSYHPAMKAIDRAYLSGNLAHGADPVLKWAASNVVPRYDGNMNMAPDKKRAPEKIDPMCALYMAMGAAEQDIEDDGNLDDFLNNPVTG